MIQKQFVDGLSKEINTLPEEFYSTFLYTTTGNNLSHPITLGAISRVVQKLPEVVYVGIDLRLNNGKGVKFQPDVVGFSADFRPILIVDYESPNSSDARSPTKDWKPYTEWRGEYVNAPVPYFVITTLPKGNCQSWELRHTSKGKYNEKFRGQRENIRSNPFNFWYDYYKTVSVDYDLQNIKMVNIDGGQVEIIDFPSS